jgi:hypothetical protein
MFVLDHPGLASFEPQLKALLELGFDGGVRALETHGYKLGDDLTNEDAREQYRNGLFASFSQLQTEVGKVLIDMEIKRRELQLELKKARVERVPVRDGIKELVGVIENRLFVLRRLMDGVLWVLLPKISIANHLAFKKEISPPQVDELRRMLQIAANLNQEIPRAIHLVSDLTTFVQIGDILTIRWDDEAIYVGLHELKSGKVNDTIGNLVTSSGGEPSETTMQDIERQFGVSGREQASRMVRQLKRFNKFKSSFEDPEPIADHPNDDLMAALMKVKPPKVRSYLTRLPELVADTREHGMGLHGIDGCLWLMGLTKDKYSHPDELTQLPHFLYHLKNPETECHRDEIAVLEKEPPLVNLALYNLIHVISRSPLIWYPKNLVLDIMMDRIRIYAQFDLNAFFQIAGRAGLGLSLITGKEAEEGKQKKLSGPMVENPKAYGVKVRFENGRSINLRSRFFSGVYSHLVYPGELLRTILVMNEAQKDVEERQG